MSIFTMNILMKTDRQIMIRVNKMSICLQVLMTLDSNAMILSVKKC